MDQDSPRDVDTSLAAHAFGELRAEVSLLRRAVERLTDERTSQPDYAPTLEAIGKRLEDVSVWARRISEKPAMQLTPESMVDRSNSASAAARRDDADLLHQAALRMDGWVAHIKGSLEQARNARDQRKWLARIAVGCSAAGILIGLFVAYLFVRSLPPEVERPQPRPPEAAILKERLLAPHLLKFQPLASPRNATTRDR